KSSVLINIKIDITTIRKITETNNPLSSPALSLDRLWIDYGKNGAVMISPEDKEGFIRHILQINPSVEVKFRKK
ncbi:MAG: PH domain-containing protein, partial [Bacteroidota bacterium]